MRLVNPTASLPRPLTPVDGFIASRLGAVRHYVGQAVMATGTKDGVQPTSPFWTHSALEALAAARASNDAAAGAFALGATIRYDYAAINASIDDATHFLREAVDRSGTPFRPMIDQAHRVAERARTLVDAALRSFEGRTEV